MILYKVAVKIKKIAACTSRRKTLLLLQVYTKNAEISETKLPWTSGVQCLEFMKCDEFLLT